MTELPVVTIFQSPKLNELGAQLITNYKQFHGDQQLAKEYLNKAIVRRYLSGQLLAENHDEIIEECGSQRAFGEKIGITESMLSNDKRAYEALAERGADTPEKMLALLHEKQIKSNIYEWERLPKFLNEPDAYREPDRRKKDEKRLEQLYEEFEEIKSRNLNDNHITQEAEYIQSEIVEVTKSILMEDPLNLEWESEHYLNFVRNYGRDILTDEPLSPDEKAHPHHVDPYTGAAGGGTANKLPDCFTIPLKSNNHRDIHDANIEYTPEQYQKAVITTMAKYIITYGK